MRYALLKKLCCPNDFAILALTVTRQDNDDHIIEGVLECTRCHEQYTISDGVPNMLPGKQPDVEVAELESVQKNTIERFGFEWQHFSNWGWLGDYPDIPGAGEKYYGGLMQDSHNAFWNKTLFRRTDLTSRHTVLDAGCGNGRFSYQAALTGAEVIGVDLGWGVKSAFQNVRSLDNVHILRGDLFRLPFKNTLFDRIFSIGVLMHTGKAGKAFDSIVRTLRPGGLVSAHVYGSGMLSYEIIDRCIRFITTKAGASFYRLFDPFSAKGQLFLTRKGRL